MFLTALERSTNSEDDTMQKKIGDRSPQMLLSRQECKELEKLLSQPNPPYIDDATIRKFLISRGSNFFSSPDDWSPEELRYCAIDSARETMRLNMERQAKRRKTLASCRAAKAT